MKQNSDGRTGVHVEMHACMDKEVQTIHRNPARSRRLMPSLVSPKGLAHPSRRGPRHQGPPPRPPGQDGFHLQMKTHPASSASRATGGTDLRAAGWKCAPSVCSAMSKRRLTLVTWVTWVTCVQNQMRTTCGSGKRMDGQRMRGRLSSFQAWSSDSNQTCETLFNTMQDVGKGPFWFLLSLPVESTLFRNV